MESDASSVQTMEHSGRERHHTNGSRRAHEKQRQEQGAKTKAKRKAKRKSKDKAKEGTSDTSKKGERPEKGHTRKDCPKFSAWLVEEKTVGHEQSANSIEEDGWIFALDHEHEELCELITIDSGASTHVCPPNHGQESGLRKSSKTRPLLTASGAAQGELPPST